MPDASPDSFVRFVSSVEGRLVSRWDAQGSCFGARLATREEREKGAEPISWDTECVVPLTAAFCAKYDRELRNAIRGGDLLERNREDWQAWLQTEEAREVERSREESPVVEQPVQETTPPPEAEPTQGRKKKQQ